MTAAKDETMLKSQAQVTFPSYQP